VHGRPEWSEGKNARSRRTVPIDPATAKAMTAHRRFQTEERLAAGPSWTEQDLVVATRHGNVVSPGNFDQTLDRLVSAAGVRRLTSRPASHRGDPHGPPRSGHR
jgi:integrase